MLDRGQFVTFEGMDGSGKTTQLNHLAEHLSAQGIPLIKTREPGGTQFGQEVRALLTTERDTSLSNLPEALLIYAARHDHVRSVIEPKLDEGCWVLCDRFIDSTFAYQFFETDLDIELFNHLNQISVGPTIPNRTYIFDIAPGIAQDRREARETSIGDQDPAEANRDYDRIRRGFQESYANDATRCVLLNASLEEAAISAAIISDIQSLQSTGGPNTR